MLHILTINVHKTYNSPASTSSSLTSNYGFGYGSNWSGHNGWPLLTEALLHDLLMAALNAPGFSEKQRWELFEISGYARSRFRVSPLLQYWPFEVLGRKPNVEEDVVEVMFHLLVIRTLVALHALLISYACYYSFTRPSSLSTTSTPNLRIFLSVTSSISWIKWTWNLVLWTVLETLSGRCSTCSLRGRLRRLQKGGKSLRRIMLEDRHFKKLFPQSFWRATNACVSSKHVLAWLSMFSMIRSILSVATSSGWVALDSSLTTQAFGSWILRNHSLLHEEIGRIGPIQQILKHSIPCFLGSHGWIHRYTSYSTWSLAALNFTCARQHTQREEQSTDYS